MADEGITPEQFTAIPEEGDDGGLTPEQFMALPEHAAAPDTAEQAKKEGLAGDIAAGLVGARNMLNPWAADMAAAAHGRTKEEQIAQDEARAEKHPYSYYGGEAAGLVGSVLAPGLGEVAGAGRLAKVANSPLVRNALIGAAYGSGQGDTLEERAKNAAVGAVASSAVGKVAEKAAGLVKGLGKSAKSAGEAVEQAKTIGVDLPSYAAGEDASTKILGKGMTTLPFGAGPINEATQKATEQLGKAKDVLGRDISAAQAGTAAEQSLNKYINQTSSGRLNAAFKNLDDVVHPQSEALLDNTRAAVDKIVGGRTSARLKSPQSAATSLVEGALADPAPMTFEGMRRLRTEIGSRMDNLWREPGDMSAGELSQIYKGLTKDLEAAARGAAGENGFRTFQEANRLTQATRRDQRALTKIIGAREGDVGPEKILGRIHKMAMSGERGDLNKLMLARRSMSPEAWNDVSSGIINNLGIGRGNEFSFNTLVTQYGKLSDMGKDVLFGPASSESRKHLEAIHDVAKRLSKADQFRNTSNTATAIHAMQFLSELMYHPFVALPQAAGSYAVSKILATPQTAKYAAGLARAIESASKYPGVELERNPAVISAARAYANAVSDSSTGDREQRASGGKVGNRDYPAKRLTRVEKALKRAQDAIAMESRPLMNQPDEEIVQALRIAKGE